jgi:preprotein translocase subunit SecY
LRSAIQPYINASIIIELLTIAIPRFGAAGRRKAARKARRSSQAITRYYDGRPWPAHGLRVLRDAEEHLQPAFNEGQTGFLYALVIILTFTAGGTFLMWMGEQIDEFGIGNGISMILFAGIISRIPASELWSPAGSSRISANGTHAWYTVLAILLMLGVLLMVVFIVFITHVRAPDPGPVRQARGRTEGLRRPEHATCRSRSTCAAFCRSSSRSPSASLPATIAAFAGYERQQQLDLDEHLCV